ncbi:23S rRNA pseudouridine1911/1915/1917 synthase [Ereboglobus sp. PH5-5]|uniref:RluA family pseudouridine synthase n=1 Tax=Ereboglobus sp. PH5-5 TaxID=2940529 RepID=UPI0024066D45|nr:RNA pseudouridine synthase [Ereboglobus sp. PH5-5]MDF9832986.1 23S rRNA pseudouridine1911/1915/1917 synthase [Ereboglobus sp. PH5-5]
MSADYEKPIGPWVRRAKEHGEGVIKKLTRDELVACVMHVDERIIAINKPGDIPCHPSKDGPWSSLSGAVREHFGDAAAHLIFRLDRETSGVVVYARDPRTARRLQMAAQNRKYGKAYFAILCGELREAVAVDQPLGPDYDCPVAIKNKVVRAGQGQSARTRFEPLQCSGGFTFARVITETGRKHQIRAHAQWLGHPLVGDKIYGPDARLFLEFIETGWTPKLAGRLLMARQALHCAEIDLRAAGVDYVFRAPPAADMLEFCRERGFDCSKWLA